MNETILFVLYCITIFYLQYTDKHVYYTPNHTKQKMHVPQLKTWVGLYFYEIIDNIAATQ